MNRLGKLTVFLCLLLALSACDLTGGPTNPTPERPTVMRTLPSDGATNVARNETVVASLNLPNSELDRETLTVNTVRLVRGDGVQVPANVTATADKTITLAPLGLLDANAQYRFEVTSGVKDLEGEALVPFSSTFTTGAGGDVERPSVQSSIPADGAVNVFLDKDVTTNLRLPGSGVDKDTLTSANVKLTKVSTGVQVAADLGSSGGNDVINLSPSDLLEPNTKYRFEVTEGVKNLDGVSFIPYTSTFTTGTRRGNLSTVAFKKTTVLTGSERDRWTTLVVGPDNKLYATTVDGRIMRFTIQADGGLSNQETLTPFGEPRLLIGLAFDPDATADNLVAWVSHTYAGFEEATINQPWSGKITRLSGPNLENVQDFVVGLPRSFKDHVTNSVAFGPDGALYFNQGANTAMGAADSTWRWQPERLLNAAMLRLDINKVTSPPVNVKTEDGGSYNPYAPNAPLTIYASGVRNAYDLVWHSNGQLYVPANGSAAGGVVPRFNASEASYNTCNSYSGPRLTDPGAVNAEYLGSPGEPRTDGWKITTTQHDFLFRVEAGGYYGHPNPERCEWILNGGNDDGGADVVPQYPEGTPPDPNYRGFTFDFGVNKSPNGAIEYQSDVFGDKLEGKLLVVRYSTGNDVVVLTPGSAAQDYDIVDTAGNEASLKDVDTNRAIGFVDPLDLVENPATGDIYVADFDEEGGNPKIVLLRPSN